MARWIHDKTKQVAIDVRYDEKYRTYTLTFEDGTERPYSGSTFKRWWKKVEDDDEYVAEINRQRKELGIECPKIDPDKVEIISEDVAGDGTPLADVGKEIAEQAKQKAEEVKKSKKQESTLSFEERQKLVLDQVKKFNFVYSIPENSQKDIWLLNTEGKKSVIIVVQTYKVAIGFTKDNVPKNMKADRVEEKKRLSHFFDIGYVSIDKLTNILSNLETIKKEEN